MRPGDFFVPGLGPLPVGASQTGSLVAFPVETYISPLIDFTQPISNIELVPAKQGHLACPPLLGGPYFGYIITKSTGTQVTPARIRAGSDAGHANFYSASNGPANFEVNNGGARPNVGSIPGTFTGGRTMFANAPVMLDITSGAIGSDSTFSLFGYVVGWVMWMGTANQ